MPYHHELYGSHGLTIIDHTSETTTPSGLIIPKQLGRTYIGVETPPSGIYIASPLDILSVVGDAALEGRLPDEVLDYESLNEMLKEVDAHLVRRITALGTIANYHFAMNKPTDKEQRLTDEEHAAMNRMSHLVRLGIAINVLDRRPDTSNPTGLYL